MVFTGQEGAENLKNNKECIRFTWICWTRHKLHTILTLLQYVLYHVHITCISVEGMVVELQARGLPSQWPLFRTVLQHFYIVKWLDVFDEGPRGYNILSTWCQFHIVVETSGQISTHVCDRQNVYFNNERDLFQTLTLCFSCLQLTTTIGPQDRHQTKPKET